MQVKFTEEAVVNTDARKITVEVELTGSEVLRGGYDGIVGALRLLRQASAELTKFDAPDA